MHLKDAEAGKKVIRRESEASNERKCQSAEFVFIAVSRQTEELGQKGERREREVT